MRIYSIKQVAGYQRMCVCCHSIHGNLRYHPSPQQSYNKASVALCATVHLTCYQYSATEII
jgi:hypothetical protein